MIARVRAVQERRLSEIVDRAKVGAKARRGSKHEPGMTRMSNVDRTKAKAARKARRRNR